LAMYSLFVVDIGAISVPPSAMKLSMSMDMFFIPRQSHTVVLNFFWAREQKTLS
jgi:hypothetical protein